MFDNAVMFIPSFICKYLMYIGTKNNISLYKHIETRRYINVDKNGNFYRFNNSIYELISKEEAIRHVLSWFE